MIKEGESVRNSSECGGPPSVCVEHFPGTGQNVMKGGNPCPGVWEEGGGAAEIAVLIFNSNHKREDPEMERQAGERTREIGRSREIKRVLERGVNRQRECEKGIKRHREIDRGIER